MSFVLIEETPAWLLPTYAETKPAAPPQTRTAALASQPTASPKPAAPPVARASAAGSTPRPAQTSVTQSILQSRLRNRRWSDRTKITRQGHISLDGNGSNLNCNVIDISKFGALIDVPDAGNASVPASFLLVFTSGRIRSEATCQTRWSDGTRIGVMFMGPVRTYVATETN